MKSRSEIEAISRSLASAYPIGDDRMIARILGEMKIVVDTRDISVTPHLVMEGFWESWITTWVVSRVGKGERVLNVGANCGYYALIFAKLVGPSGRVVAVEPQPRLAEGIEMSAALNGFSGNLSVRRCIAGTQHRSVMFRVPDRLLGGASVTSNENECDFSVGEVPAHELMPDATGVFIDAEGYEPIIWSGLAPLIEKRQLKWIAMEWAPSRYVDAAAFLKEIGSYGSVCLIATDGSEKRADSAHLLSIEDHDTVLVRPW